jgi:hypothetical protein
MSDTLPPEIAALLDDFRNAAQDYAFTRYTDDDIGRDMVEARAALETAITALVRDVERMRWLSAGNCCDSMPGGYRVWSGEKDTWYAGATLSAAIDAAFPPKG